MNERERQREILDSWRRLSSAETEAIDAGDWGHLVTLQDAKRALQGRLTGRGEAASAPPLDPALAPDVAELVALERANLALLGRRQAAADLERADAERARRNLRRQQELFGARTSNSWQQYS